MPKFDYAQDIWLVDIIMTYYKANSIAKRTRIAL